MANGTILNGIIMTLCVLIIVFIVMENKRTHQFQQEFYSQQANALRQFEELNQKLSLLMSAQQKGQDLLVDLDAQQAEHMLQVMAGQQTQVMAQFEESKQWTAKRFHQLHMELFGQSSATSTPDPRTLSKPDRWQRLVQSVIDGDADALQVLQQAMETDSSVQTIGIADTRKYQNSVHYAEFTVQSFGECLLIPLDDESSSQYIALPYPNDSDWFVRNHALLSRLYRFDGDWTSPGQSAHIQCAALLRQKSLDESAHIYELVQRGILVF